MYCVPIPKTRTQLQPEAIHPMGYLYCGYPPRANPAFPCGPIGRFRKAVMRARDPVRDAMSDASAPKSRETRPNTARDVRWAERGDPRVSQGVVYIAQSQRIGKDCGATRKL